jgi:hypothetical protein
MGHQLGPWGMWGSPECSVPILWCQCSGSGVPASPPWGGLEYAAQLSFGLHGLNGGAGMGHQLDWGMWGVTKGAQSHLMVPVSGSEARNQPHHMGRWPGICTATFLGYMG